MKLGGLGVFVINRHKVANVRKCHIKIYIMLNEKNNEYRQNSPDSLLKLSLFLFHLLNTFIFTKGHSMAETLTVALRVAEEAIEEAISKAEEYRGSLVSS